MSKEEESWSYQQIIDDTLAALTRGEYGINPDTQNCVYNNRNGHHCAVGRCLTPEARERLKGVNDSVANIGSWDAVDSLTGMRVVPIADEDFLPRFRGKPLEFWDLLQQIHDQLALLSTGRIRGYTARNSVEAFLDLMQEQYGVSISQEVREALFHKEEVAP